MTLRLFAFSLLLTAACNTETPPPEDSSFDERGPSSAQPTPRETAASSAESSATRPTGSADAKGWSLEPRNSDAGEAPLADTEDISPREGQPARANMPEGSAENSEGDPENNREPSKRMPIRSMRNTFESYTDLVDSNPVQRRYGMAVTDFDLDGDYEVVVTGYGAANEVLDWRDGRIVDVAPNELKDPGRRAIGVAACDVSGDGQEEIYFLNVDRFGGLGEVSDRLFKRTSNGWADLFENPVNAASVNRFSGRSVACLDRTGSGQYGVFVANYGGPMKLFELTDGQLIDRGTDIGVDRTTGGRSVLVLPGDNGLDVFAGNERGPNFMFENQGDGTFVERAQPLGIADPYETVRGVASLDANGDGLMDLVYGNWEGPHRLFIRQSDGRFVDAASPEMGEPSRIRTVIAADFDNDGREEIFWNNIGQPNRLFKWQDGTWVVADIGDALEADGLGTGAAVVDIDEDGVLELFVAHGESGAQPLSVFRWGANDNHYLRIAPKTRQGGPARGAHVLVVLANGREHRRVIDSGSGYLCQMEPVAHVGLGQVTEIDYVEVTWPDGSITRIDEPRADQKLNVSYPGGGPE